MPDPPLHDGRIALRAWREEDVPALVASCSDELTMRFTSVPSPYTPEDARLFVGTGRSDAALPLAIVEADDDAQVLGAVGLHAVDRGRGRGEIGYWTSPWARRQGIATRALVLLSRWALDPEGLALRRLELYAEPVNLASQEVARRAGFTQGDLVRG